MFIPPIDGKFGVAKNGCAGHQDQLILRGGVLAREDALVQLARRAAARLDDVFLLKP